MAEPVEQAIPKKDDSERVTLLMRFSLVVAVTGLCSYCVVTGIDTPDYMIAILTGAWGWFFYTSKGSSDKTNLLGKVNPNA